MISVEQIKQLRGETGVSIAQCKKALEESGGNIEAAREELAKLGAVSAAKKAGRHIGAGRVGFYIHNDGSMGVLLSLGCETDFVAKNPEFQEAANDLAMHVAAMAPESAEELLEQPFIKNPEQTVNALVQEKIQKFGEGIKVVEWQRLAIGRA